LRGSVVLKKGIHPKYSQTTVRCSCGETFQTGSTKQNLSVEICSKCHPLFTGRKKWIDTAGRVEKFNKKYGVDIRKD